MAESNLAVVLKLTALFGGAAQDAARDLDAIAERIDKLGEKKGVFAGLQTAANDLNSTLTGVADKLKGLDLGLGSVSTKADSTTRTLGATKSSVDDLGRAAASASTNVAATGNAVESLGAKAAKVKDVAAAVNDVAAISDHARTSFMSLMGKIDQSQKGNFSPLILGLESVREAARKAAEQVAALNAEKARIKPGVPVGEVIPAYDLQRDVSAYERQRRNYQYRNEDAVNVRYSPHNDYANVLGTSAKEQVALPSGGIFESQFQEIATGLRRIQAEAKAAEAAASSDAVGTYRFGEYRQATPQSGGAERLSLPSGTIFEAEFREIAAGFKRLQAEARAAAAAASEPSMAQFNMGSFRQAMPMSGQIAPPTDFGRNALTPYVFQGEAEDRGYVPPDAINAKFRATRASDYFNRGKDFNADYSDVSEGAGAGHGGPSMQDLDAMDAAARLQAEEEMRARRVREFQQREANSQEIYKRGDKMQSVGYANMVNGAMLVGIGAPMFSSAMQTEQFDNQNEITARANGANAQAVNFLQRTVHGIAQRNGGDYTDVIGSGAAFIGSMTPSANINQKDWQSQIAYALDRASKVSVVSTAGGAQISASQTAIATNQAIANLGIDVSTPQKFRDAVQEVTNMLVKMKNVTPSTVPDTLSFLRAVGPVASLNHMAPEDMTGLIYALGKEKMVGSSAGNAVKRLFQRETLPAKKTLEIQELFKEKKFGGFDLSMYDEHGKARSMIDVLDQVSQADKKGHWSDQTRSQVVGQLSGLYANAPIGALLQFMEKNGGKQGLRQQGSSIMHGGIEGSGKKDAVDAEAEKQFKSLLNTVQVTTAKIREAWQGVFKDIEPQLTAFVKGIGRAADAFAGLPKPVKDFAAYMGILAVAISIGGGVLGVFGGNIVKTFGYLTGLANGIIGIKTGFTIMEGGAKSYITVGDRLVAMFGSLWSGIGQLAVGFTRLSIVAPIFEGLTAAAGAFGAAVTASLGPISIAIAAIVAVVGLFALAWRTDFGNIREITETVKNGIGVALNATGSFFVNLNKVINGWADGVSSAMGRALRSVNDFLGQAIPGLKKFTQGLDAEVEADAKHNAALTAKSAPQYVGAVGPRMSVLKPEPINTGFGGTAAAVSTANPISLTNTAWESPTNTSGPRLNKPVPVVTSPPVAKPIDFGNLGDGGSGSNVGGGGGGEETPGLRQALDKIMDPSGHGKKKKGKKGHVTYDVDIHIGEIPASEVEAAAREIEKKWATSKHPPHHKPQWLNLMDQSGNIAERTYGDPAAFRQADKNLAPDKGLKDKVTQYLEQAKFWRTGTEAEVNKLEEFLKRAKTQGLRAYIEGQIADVNSAQLKQIGKVKEDFTKNHNAFYGEEGTSKNPTGGIVKQFSDTQDSAKQTIDDANKSFAELQNAQKNAIPTVDQLKERYNLLYNEQKALSNDQDKMASEIDDVTQRLASQATELSKITGNTSAARQARAALSAEMASERGTLTQLNSGLALQRTQLDQVTVSMNRANAEYEKAVAYQKTLAYAFQQAGLAAKQAVDQEGGNILGGAAKGLFNRVTGDGYRSNDVSKLVGTYVSSYIDSAAGPLAKALLPGQKDQAKESKVFDTKTFGAADESSKTLKDIHATIKSQSDDIKGANENTQVLKGMQQSGDGALPVKGTSTYASGSGNSSFSGADMDDASFGDWGGSGSTKKQGGIDSFLQSKTGKDLTAGLGALASLTAGMQQGGVGGAVTAGVGTFTSLSSAGVPPQIATPIAAAAAVVSLFTHHDNPAAMPDKYDTQNYGQSQADLLGSGYGSMVQNGAEGKYFTEDNQTATATNNMGDIQYIRQWAAANVNNSDPSIAKAAQTDLATWGQYDPTATSGNDILNYDPKNIGNENVKGGTEAGTYISIANDATTAVNAIQQLGSASLQAAQNAKALADSFTANLINGPSGFSIPYLGATFGGNASSSFLPSGATAGVSNIRSVGGGNLGSTTIAPPQQNITVRILEGATVGNAQDVADAVNNAIPTITNAVNQANYNQMRMAQGYQSQLS